PFVEEHSPASFPGAITDPNIAERNLVDDEGMPLCPEVPLHNEDGTRNPEAYTLMDQCVDRARIGGDNHKDYYERYVSAEYKTRFADGKAGATLKGYFVKFYRGMDQLNVLAPSTLSEGGL